MRTFLAIKLPNNNSLRSENHYLENTGISVNPKRERPNRNTSKEIIAAAMTLMMQWSIAPHATADSAETHISQGTATSYKEITYLETLRSQQSTQRVGNYSAIRQEGNRNSAFISQELQESSQGNVAVIDQLGSDNDAAIIQYGTENVGVLLQHGSGLSNEMYQQGQQLEAFVQQSGYSAGLTLSQSGSGLRAIQVRQWAPSGVGARVTVDTR